MVDTSGEPAYANSWVTWSAGYAARFRMDPRERRWLELDGAVKTGTITAPIFTLPVGWRPATAKIVPVSSNGAYGELEIDTSGNVTPLVGSNTLFSLAGIRVPLD